MPRNPLNILDSKRILVAPSILAANFAELGNCPTNQIMI